MYAERNSRLTKGPASDRIHRLSRQRRTECDLTSIRGMDDQSLRGQTRHHRSAEPTSHGITFSRHDVLGASHTRKASPLLAGESAESLPHRATQLPDKEFRSSLPWTCPSGRAFPEMPFPACRHADGTISSPSGSRAPGVWSLRIPAISAGLSC